MKLVKGDNGNSDFGWIGRGIEVTGDIIFADRLQVDGKVWGKLSSESGTLMIGEMGTVEAQLDVGICVIQGTLSWQLDCKIESRDTQDGPGAWRFDNARVACRRRRSL